LGYAVVLVPQQWYVYHAFSRGTSANQEVVMASKEYVRNPHMRAICAGTSHSNEGGNVEPVLIKTMHSIALPICDKCKSRRV